jgi:hypothetical protein
MGQGVTRNAHFEGHVAGFRQPKGGPVDYRALLKAYMRGVVDAEGCAFVNADFALSGPDLAELQAIEAELKAVTRAELQAIEAELKAK